MNKAQPSNLYFADFSFFMFGSFCSFLTENTSKELISRIKAKWNYYIHEKLKYSKT